MKVNKLTRLIPIIAVTAFSIAGIILNIYPHTNAQPVNQQYGQCAYGVACPTSPNPGPTPTPPPVTEPESENNEPEEPLIVQEIPAPTPPSQPAVVAKKRASETVEVKGIQGIILKQTVNIVDRIPESHRKVVPYYSWLFLLILSAVMLVIAGVDRYKSVKLTKAIKNLQSVLIEQKTFLRLALHNLNTPLATVKGVLEILQNAKPIQTDVISVLRPATLQLEATIERTTSEIMDESSLNSENQDLKMEKIGFIGNLNQWYFFIPVVFAILFGVLINSAISYTETQKPQNFALYQVATAFMVCLIFANSIRIFKISRRQQQIFNKVRVLIENLNTKRSQLISSLSQSLDDTTSNIQKACKKIDDQKMASILSDGVTRLMSLTSKVSSATAPLSGAPAAYSIPDLINEVIANYQDAINQKSLDIKTKFKTTDNILIFKPELTMILSSLVENAIQYTEQGKSVLISTDIKKSSLHIDIKDEGEGINQEDLDKLFKPFSRTDDVLTYDRQGMGLSLYVSKTIAKRMGGDIEIKSKEGSGTTATIIIPVN